MRNIGDTIRIAGIIQKTKFPSFPGGSEDVKVGDQLPYHAIVKIAENLLKNGLVIDGKQKEIHAHWICKYNPMTGETEVKCSHCGDTRDISGCYETTDGKSCYYEDWHCPFCGSTMDERVD